MSDHALYHPDVWDDTSFSEEDYRERWDRDVKREVHHSDAILDLRDPHRRSAPLLCGCQSEAFSLWLLPGLPQ